MKAEVVLKEKVVNFNTIWKFEIGDNHDYSNTEYDDSFWSDIRVPSSWEDEGFPGYDGYAWYRIEFEINSKYEEEILYIKFGPIDDVDETYLNGTLVGKSGGFPPDYYTNAHSERLYFIPNTLINFNGKNVISVRVYDDIVTGGIIKGNNGIFTAEYDIMPDIAIDGLWKFSIGDNPDWKNEKYDDSDWIDVVVPSQWNLYNYEDYDGFAWYRKKIVLNDLYEGDKLILLVGKIDDIDETFFNGVRIGKTGHIGVDADHCHIEHEDQYQLRAYYVPSSILKFGEENTIAVRVYDGLSRGGIFEGPVGFVDRDTYRKYTRTKKKSIKSFLEDFFD